MAGQPSSRTNKDLWLLEDVGFGYGQREALRNVSLRFEAGKCYGILGPNGSGKTTLLDLLCGLLQAQSGTLLLYGKPLSEWTRRQLARILALVPQDFMVRFGFTVREVVEMGRYPHLHRFSAPTREDYRLIDEVMDRLGVSGMADRQVTMLSGGEKQRVAVARALVQSPRVLMLDEATSNLDIFHSLEILQVIRRLIDEQGLTVVAVLHDLNLAASFCDELIFLQAGRIISRGKVEDVLHPEIISQVYGVEALVRDDGFTGCRQVSVRALSSSESRAPSYDSLL